MKIYVLKRILSALVIMWAVATIVFICIWGWTDPCGFSMLNL
jgi:hypothetical protein